MIPASGTVGTATVRDEFLRAARPVVRVAARPTSRSRNTRRQLLVWWQKKLPLKNQPSNPLAQLLRGGMDVAPRYLARGARRTAQPRAARRRSTPSCTTASASGALAEFQKFVDFALSDKVLTAGGARPTCSSSASALGLSGEDIAGTIEAGLQGAPVRDARPTCRPPPPPPPAPAAPPPAATIARRHGARPRRASRPTPISRAHPARARQHARGRFPAHAAAFRAGRGIHERRPARHLHRHGRKPGPRPRRRRGHGGRIPRSHRRTARSRCRRAAARTPRRSSRPGPARSVPPSRRPPRTSPSRRWPKPEGIRLSPGGAAKSGTVVSTAARPVMQLIDPAGGAAAVTRIS